MSEKHDQPAIRRLCDVAIVGGSAAGLAAALQIQRQDRSVIVVDSGQPRNAAASQMHGYLGLDGARPGQLADLGREEVRRYGGEVLSGRVRTVERDSDMFVLDAGAVEIRARRVIAATGVVDELPRIEGISKHWGDTVIHCPFCHGYEVRGERLVQIITHPIGLHPARLWAHLSPHLTLVVDPDVDIDATELATLTANEVTVLEGTVERIVEDDQATLTGVQLSDQRTIAADAVLITTDLRCRVDPFEPLGLSTEPHPLGVADYVVTDPMGQTSVQGLYAVGNLTDPSHQVLGAAANGSHVGAMVAMDLAVEDQTQDRRVAAGEAEWEARYSGDQIWSGAPNGTLVQEVGDLPVGRALDVGAGEGGDALWLVQQGWDVTATDIATSGLSRLASQAEAEGLALRCLATDANALKAFGHDTYDLVSLFYSAIPRTGDHRGIQNLLDAVAPGGTLLMVGHAPHGHPADADHTSPWDRLSFVGIDQIAAVLGEDPAWTIVTNETRERPPGSASHSHHSEDVVLRAQRKPRD